MKIFELGDIEISLPVRGGDRVVLVNWERLNDTPSRKRNVFRLAESGEIVWQVSDYRAMPHSTFTNIYFDDTGALKGYNFDGAEYDIDAETGGCVPSRLLK